MDPLWQKRLAAGAGAALVGVAVGIVLVNGPLADEPEPVGDTGPVTAPRDTEPEPEPAPEPAAVPEAGGDAELERASRAALDTVGGGRVARIEREDDDDIAYEVRVVNERGEFEVAIGHDFHVVEVEQKSKPEKGKDDDDG